MSAEEETLHYQVGQSAGAGRLDVLQQRVWLAIYCALGAGVIAFGALAGLQFPVSAFFALSSEVRAEASLYWWLRAALAPFTLLNMALSGILQGYKRVGVSAALNTGQSIVELCGSYVVLALVQSPSAGRLASLGAVSLASAILATILGGVSVILFSPRTPDKAEDFREALLDAGAPQGAGLTETEHAAMACSALEEDRDKGADAKGQNHLWDFILDGTNMLIRSATLQATFFLALSVAGQLGTATLAAHQVVAQLWLLPAYIVDAFAVAGTVLGSRIAANIEQEDAIRRFRLLTQRLVSMGVVVGMLCGVGIWAGEGWIISLFTSDAEAMAVLQDKLWAILCLAQPINSAIFVYDGLLYATHSFAWVRNIMLSGFVLTFAPMLALTQWRMHALWSIWAAKGLMNVWRLLGAIGRIHFSFEREAQLHAAAS